MKVEAGIVTLSERAFQGIIENAHRAGMNEVAEWINEQIAEMDRTGYYPKREMWQSQKKKWGIDEKVIHKTDKC